MMMNNPHNHAASAAAAAAATGVSPFSGRWTHEEEQYAEALMEEFRAGSLSIPTGTKLRGYLADKLRCFPKRYAMLCYETVMSVMHTVKFWHAMK